MSREDYEYSIGDHGAENRYPVPEWADIIDLEETAEHCARDFYYDHEGYGKDRDWPWHLRIYGPDGAEVGRFQIHVEVEPVFTVEEGCE